MSNENNGNDEQPVFDFDELSWGDSKDVTRLISKVGAISAKAQALNAMNTDELSAAQLDKRQRDIEANDAALVDAMDGIQKFMAAVVISIPQSWLVRRAPDNPDWNDPASFDYLRSSRFMDLVAAFQGAEANEKKD